MNDSLDAAGEQARARLRQLRQARGWSLAEMARQVPYSKSYLSKLETGAKPITPDIARCLDKALDTGGVLATVVPTADRATPVQDEPRDSQVCPYPGLAAFGPDQTRWFFSREQITAHLISQLDDRLARGGLLAVIAPSGAGKSSLLAAGLIPALAGGALPESRGWPVVTVTPSAQPVATLIDRIIAVTGADPGSAAEAGGHPDRFTTFLTRAAAAYTSQAVGSTRVVLIVDQFEETFTGCHQESERQAFIATLAAAANSAVALVVLGLRADFYGRCLAYPALHTAVQTPVVLGPMSTEQLRAVITRPAETEQLRLEPGLVELLLRDLGVTDDAGATGYDPGALPLLAHALRMTWQQRNGRVLTVAGYRRTGGISQALATTAEDAYTRLNDVEQHTARHLLLRLVNVSDQGTSADTRRRLARAELIEALPQPEPTQAVEKVLEVFGQARLLTFDTSSVQITHEALLQAWPRLRAWIDTDRAGNIIRQELEHAATVWDRDRRDTAVLYRGSRLEAARTWTATTLDGELSPAASAFLTASARQEHRLAQRRRVVLVVLSVLALVASGAAAVAVQQRAVAQSERDTAIFNQVTAQADRLRSTDISLAAQLDLTAYRMHPADQNLSTALITDANTTLSTPLASGHGTIRAATFSEQGRLLASGGDDGTVRLWNTADPMHPQILGPPLSGHIKQIRAVAFSPDGHTLASGGGDEQPLRLWNVTNPTHPTALSSPMTDHTSYVNAVAFSPDGRILATGGSDYAVRLWNVTDPAHPAPLSELPPVHTSDVNAVPFSPDGRTLATGCGDGTVRLWNVTDPAHPTSLGPPLVTSEQVNTVAFSPNGHLLASGGNDQAVRLWEVGDPGHPTPLGLPVTDHTNYVNAVAFSPDSRIMAVGSDDQKLRLWNVSDPARPALVGPPLAGHESYVNVVAFRPDGHSFLTAGSDGIIRFWTIPATLITAHTSPVYSAAFTPHGHTLATRSDDGTVRLWNVADPAQPTPLGQVLSDHASSLNGIAFSPDGRTLATGSDDTAVRLWNVTDPAHPTALGQLPAGPTKPVNAVAFSLNGHTLVTGSNDHTIRLWNVTDPAHPTPLSQFLSDQADSLNALAFSPDGHTLATGSDDAIVRLWNVTDPTHPGMLAQLPRPNVIKPIHAVVFSPDGHTLAIGSHDGATRLWNMTDPTRPTLLSQLRTEHADSVNTVAFSLDGHTLATGSRDQTVRLWDVTDPAHPSPVGQPLTGHTGFVNATAFSPDGHTLASASDDETIRLWERNIDQAIQHICAATRNTLTPAKWNQYVSPTLPYSPPCP